MLASGHADASWFSGSFLAQVPVSKLDEILGQLKSALGAYKSLDGAKGDYTARFDKGTDEVLIHLDADNKIGGLFFKPPKIQSASLDDALAGLRPASGTLSYVILEGRSERAALNASTPLAVGSAFKLAVLAALRDEVARGRRHWTDIVPLQSAWKSLRSGVLQSWPEGLPLTLATYAADMISMSDNTAADALVRLDGPAALAAYARGNAPFLTTREVFILKSATAAAERGAYIARSTAAARAAVLRRVDALPLPPATDVPMTPILAVEWHYSVRDLCALMERVSDLPLMTINPGVADPRDFLRVAFKGGSDSGVLNLTTEVTTKRGTRICFSATLNDTTKSPDETAFGRAYANVLTVLSRT